MHRDMLRRTARDAGPVRTREMRWHAPRLRRPRYR